MDSLVSRPRRSVQLYWARRNYQRLGWPPLRRLRVARLGSDGARKHQLPPGSVSVRRAGSEAPWKNLVVAVALAAARPARLLARLRDAYVDAMLAVAGRPCAAAALARTRSCAAPEAGGGLMLARRVPRARTTRASSSDFERRMMAHIYNVVVTPELPRAAANKA